MRLFAASTDGRRRTKPPADGTIRGPRFASAFFLRHSPVAHTSLAARFRFPSAVVAARHGDSGCGLRRAVERGAIGQCLPPETFGHDLRPRDEAFAQPADVGGSFDAEPAFR